MVKERSGLITGNPGSPIDFDSVCNDIIAPKINEAKLEALCGEEIKRGMGHKTRWNALYSASFDGVSMFFPHLCTTLQIYFI